MSKIIIREINERTSSDINIKNERFKLFGRMIPSYQNGKWSYTVSENEEESWDCFPDENYSYEKMAKDIATDLIDESFKYALEHGYRGVWTIGQDRNLAACLFYINNGFRIGGIDTDVYIGTSLERNADIYFYKD